MRGLKLYWFYGTKIMILSKTCERTIWIQLVGITWNPTFESEGCKRAKTPGIIHRFSHCGPRKKGRLVGPEFRVYNSPEHCTFSCVSYTTRELYISSAAIDIIKFHYVIWSIQSKRGIIHAIPYSKRTSCFSLRACWRKSLAGPAEVSWWRVFAIIETLMASHNL